MSIWTAAARRIHASAADPVLYTGAGLDSAAITGTKYDVAADAFRGAGSTARRVWFEIQQSDLPQAPAKRNIIRHTDPMTGATTNWAVIDIARRDDIGAWDLTVEKT